MQKAAGEEEIELPRQLVDAVFSNVHIPADWEERFILNLCEGKNDAPNHGDYQGLKLTDQVMKLLELVLEFYIWKMVNMNDA